MQKLGAAMVLAASVFVAGAAPPPKAAKPAPTKTTPKPASNRPTVRSETKRDAAGPADKRVDGDLAYPGGVTATRDVIYAEPDGFRPLRLDLYRPGLPANDSPRPALIFVHGGLWRSGDNRHGGGFDDFPSVLASLAAKGFVVASIDYRLSGEARFPAALFDVKTAIAWMKSHGTDYGIDVTRIAIWGEEAGGQLAGLAATACGVTALEPPGTRDDRAPPDCVNAAILWDAITDMSHEPPSGKPGAIASYLGCEPSQCAPGVTHAASPESYAGPNSPPFLLQQIASPPSASLYDSLAGAHVPVEKAVASNGDAALQTLSDFLAKTFPAPPRPEPPPVTKNRARRR
jgi:acetyl esterase/lipase